MSLDRKLQRRLDYRPYNLRLFLAISLLLHGVLFLGLKAYWRSTVNHPLLPKPDAVIPVKFIEVPAERVAITPPLHAKYLASSNSRAGGKAHRELPSKVGGFAAKPTIPLSSRLSSLTQSKLSTPHPSQPYKPRRQPQPPSLAASLPLLGSQSNISPSVAPTAPKLKLSHPQPTSLVVNRPQHLPNTNHLALNSHQNISPPAARTVAIKSSNTQPTSLVVNRPQHIPHPNRLALNSHPNISPPVAPTVAIRSSNIQPQHTSPLGGTVYLSSHDFTSVRRGIPDAGRLMSDSQGVDARKDVNLGPYLDAVWQQVVQHWSRQVSNSLKQTIISFSISRNGQVTNLQILQSSGSTLKDQAALRAVQQAEPFAPLPENYPFELYKIRFKFNVHGAIELKS